MHETTVEPWDEGDGRKWANSGCMVTNPGATPGKISKPLASTSSGGEGGGRLGVRYISTRWPTVDRPGLTTFGPRNEDR